MTRSAIVLTLGCALGCGRPGDADTGFTSAPGTSVTTHSTSSSSSGTQAGSTSTSTGVEDSSAASHSASTGSPDSTTGIADLGIMPDFGGPPAGCKGKIDFVFAISASPNMVDEQAKVTASFPGFVATIEQEFPDFDYHIMVAGSRGSVFACEGCQGSCPMGPPDYPCNEPVTSCDLTEGAGITLPRGWYASNQRCELFGGRRYIQQGEPDLLAAFTCIATVGRSGDDSIVEDAVYSVSPAMIGRGGCNAGFLRDDALLVITVITDGDDDLSGFDPEGWRQAFFDAKGGDGDAIVLFIVASDRDQPQGLCQPYIPYVSKLRTWSTLMPHAIIASVCEPDYTPFFAEAAALVKQQCEVFVPQ